EFGFRRRNTRGYAQPPDGARGRTRAPDTSPDNPPASAARDRCAALHAPRAGTAPAPGGACLASRGHRACPGPQQTAPMAVVRVPAVVAAPWPAEPRGTVPVELLHVEDFPARGPPRGSARTLQGP